jgi:hypothetical protein
MIVYVGDAARFECIATAKPKPTYQWFKVRAVL